MAGTKRRADAPHSSNSQHVVSTDYSNQDATSGLTQVRATRGSRSRVAATSATSASSMIEGDESPKSVKTFDLKSEDNSTNGISSQFHKQPRAKRQKLSPTSEVLKPSRYSTRLKARADSPISQELPPRLSPQSPVELLTASATDSTNDSMSKHDEDTHTGEQTLTSSIDDLNHSSRLSPKSSDAGEPGMPQDNSYQAKSASTRSPNTDARTRKRLSEDFSTVDPDLHISPMVISKKLEDEEKSYPNVASFQTESMTASEEAQDTQAFEYTSQPITNTAETYKSENIDHAGSAQNDNTSGSGSRGRGNRGRGSGRGRSTRGRARGAALTRGAGRGRGRGAGRGGGKGGRRNDDDSDVEMERSPSPGPAVQRLLERQKELKQNWKRLAATQKLMLSVLATRTQQRLARDKNAHRRAPEFEEVQAALEDALRRREHILANEYRLRVEEAKNLMQGEVKIIQERFEVNICNIQDEHFYAARGDYMELVEGVQHAEDDEHTEPDVDGVKPESVDVAEADEPTTIVEPLYLNEPRFQRGYNSRFIREKPGAAAYERGKYGWDDFMQREKMKEISQEESVADPIQLLLKASTEAIANEEAIVNEVGPSSSVNEAFSEALSALADAASNAQPVSGRKISMPMQAQTQGIPQFASVRIDQPQQPPSFMLPAPPPSRPVLSASRGFPDLFTTGRGLPQLPPPPGVAFDYSNRPGPLPGFITSQHQSSALQYQPPPPPAPPMQATAATTAPYYFPGRPHPHPHPHPHSHQPPPAPPSQTSTSTPHQRY